MTTRICNVHGVSIFTFPHDRLLSKQLLSPSSTTNSLNLLALIFVILPSSLHAEMDVCKHTLKTNIKKKMYFSSFG